MAQTMAAEAFTTYSDLLEARIGMYAGLPSAGHDEAAVLHQDIALLDQELSDSASSPALAASALHCGKIVANEVCVLPLGTDTQTRSTYEHRLARAAAVVLENGAGSPELTEDEWFLDVQAALGALAAWPDRAEDNAPAAQDSEAAPLKPVDYAVALQGLCNHVAAMTAGESYELNPAQLLTLAAPDMAMSRHQRYRLLRKARQVLTAQGYIFRYNNGRGKYSAYTVGRPAPALTAPMQLAA